MIFKNALSKWKKNGILAKQDNSIESEADELLTKGLPKVEMEYTCYDCPHYDIAEMSLLNYKHLCKFGDPPFVNIPNPNRTPSWCPLLNNRSNLIREFRTNLLNGESNIHLLFDDDE